MKEKSHKRSSFTMQIAEKNKIKIAEELRFSRLDSQGEPRPHDIKDAQHLALPLTHADHQHVLFIFVA